jgi:hypothetical protein
MPQLQAPSSELQAPSPKLQALPNHINRQHVPAICYSSSSKPQATGARAGKPGSWGRMGPRRAAWGRVGPQNKQGENSKFNQARGSRLLFAALAFGQQPTVALPSKHLSPADLSITDLTCLGARQRHPRAFDQGRGLPESPDGLGHRIRDTHRDRSASSAPSSATGPGPGAARSTGICSSYGLSMRTE